jgi:hypothetical protein
MPGPSALVSLLFVMVFLFLMISPVSAEDIGTAGGKRSTASSVTSGPGPGEPKTPGGWRLRGETSPYLRRHVEDHVAWRPWGEEAFREARQRGLPVFVSIGYASCYWCHVLQREVFRNPSLAAYLNRHFVPVLVDREQRPDVDAYFQAVMRLVEGRGGWPANVLLTPEMKPVLAFGYVPPSRFRRYLERFVESWAKNPALLRREAENVMSVALLRLSGKAAFARALPDDGRLAEKSRELVALFDPFAGGLLAGPKHFRVPVLNFLLETGVRLSLKEAREAVFTTLDVISKAAVMDQLDGGFFRYATDPSWNIPHYEKMLTDQALLADLLLSAWLASGRSAYLRTARRTLDYVLKDLRDETGAFFTARDALSEGREGGFYLFSPRELEDILGKGDAAFLIRVSGGLVAHGEASGRIVPNLSHAETRKEEERAQALLSRLAAWRRAHRRPPARDEKVIAAYNGMMIAALARAARLLDEQRYGQAARKAAGFILNRLRNGEDGLFRVYHAGRAAIPALLEDHAWMILGLLHLHDLAEEENWIDFARSLAHGMLKRFLLADGRLAESQKKTAMPRLVVWRDTALPSAQAVAVRALLGLWRRTGEEIWRRSAERIIAGNIRAALGEPLGGAGFLREVLNLRHGPLSALRYTGGGVVKAGARILMNEKEKAREGKNGHAPVLLIRLRLAEGWHVNANPPGEKWLVPVRLKALDAEGELSLEANWPMPVYRRLALSQKPLPLLEGEIAFTARAARALSRPVRLWLTVQPCSENACLPPESPEILPVPPALP